MIPPAKAGKIMSAFYDRRGYRHGERYGISA